MKYSDLHMFSGSKHKRTAIKTVRYFFSMLTLFLILSSNAVLAEQRPVFNYKISIDNPGSHLYHVTLETSGWQNDTLELKLPVWMPGYYQVMDYAKFVTDMTAKTANGQELKIIGSGESSWTLTGVKNKRFRVDYNIETNRRFVANSYVDEEHAYIVPSNTFLYAESYLSSPVTVTFISAYRDIATGLKKIAEDPITFTAPDFDILYDCPILAGNLDSFPSFKVNGIEHRFTAYKPGTFNAQLLMQKLQQAITYATTLMGDIPYESYTFIGIGPGRGGIEHLNNTIVSFNGDELVTEKAFNKTLNFLVHEYFHNYNVKRIRPYELGPFDYGRENRTNQLWISEGLTVYYEYLILKRAGLIDTGTLFSNLENDINATENDPGRHFQSLTQASYYTWEDGPFGTPEGTEDKSISYYQKGPVMGLLLDFTIRQATQNKKSLDDVMRYLYREFYQDKQRGFTEAEFQQVCEEIAGQSLRTFFEYICTTKEPDYATYLSYAGLELKKEKDQNNVHYRIKRMDQPDKLQNEIFNSWITGF
ncbi:M61 family metallopeptidase [Saccharicrinis sp. FJH54]|uniref:M61 family metallopeptidase n=1 Tax=Saccharicrinis sp. FJH54 TaxID=3344665 RepID=UPI0035D4631A